MARYDEDLHENVFFHTLVTKFSELFREAAENQWMVSVFITLIKAHHPAAPLYASSPRYPIMSCINCCIATVNNLQKPDLIYAYKFANHKLGVHGKCC